MAYLALFVGSSVASIAYFTFRHNNQTERPAAAPVDPHQECLAKRRVLVTCHVKKYTRSWSAFVLEEYEGHTYICNEDDNTHQWVLSSQVQDLVPLKANRDIEELERLHKL
jgi:hypothetical protein